MKLLLRNSLRIIHVESSASFADYLKGGLYQAGFREVIRYFEDGKSALNYLNDVGPTEAPHVVILGLDLRGLSGLQTLRCLRKYYCNHDVPVLILTVSDSSEDMQLALEAGATRYLVKSDNLEELIDALDVCITIHNHLQMELLMSLPRPMVDLAVTAFHSDDMIVLTDFEGYLVWANESFLRTCGYFLEEIRGKKPGRVLQGPKTDPNAVKVMQDAVRTATPCTTILTNYRKNKEPYEVQISMGPIFTNDKLEGFYAFEKDLSQKAQPTFAN